MTRRTRAREVALQVLFQDDLNPCVDPSVADEFIRRRLRTSELAELSRALVAGVRRNRPQLDGLIEKTAANWSLSRMAVTDRNVLRLGAYEILFSDTPGAVAINEAVELAKRYGTAQSAQFVNGILDRLMHARGSGAGTRGRGSEIGDRGSEIGDRGSQLGISEASPMGSDKQTRT
jgi:N utilization substance protein B